MTESTNIRKVFNVSPRMEEMLQEIRESKGFMTDTATLHYCIATAHSKAFPNYVVPQGKKETPMEKLQRQALVKEAKEEMVLNEYRDILKQLGGHEETNESGKNVAVYYTYAHKKRYEQRVPLYMLSTDLLKNQYSPDRATVEKLQREKKTDYKV